MIVQDWRKRKYHGQSFPEAEIVFLLSATYFVPLTWRKSIIHIIIFLLLLLIVIEMIPAFVRILKGAVCIVESDMQNLVFATWEAFKLYVLSMMSKFFGN